MILILDGISGHVTHERIFLKINFIFATTVDLSKRLQQIKWLNSLYTCTPIAELPSNISAMGANEKCQLRTRFNFINAFRV